MGTWKNYTDAIKGYAKLPSIFCGKEDVVLWLVVLFWALIPAFVTWCLVWPVVLFGPIITYLSGFVIILTMWPLFYIISWIFFIVSPLATFGAVVCVSPFFSVRCPYVALKHSATGNLGRSMKHGFLEPFRFGQYLDHATADIAFNLHFIPGSAQVSTETFSRVPIGVWMPIPESTWKLDIKEGKPIDYWSLYLDKCTDTKNELWSMSWITLDDIETASPNVLIAVPAIAIAQILFVSFR